MQHPARFVSPSSSLALEALLRRGHRVVWTGLILAVGLHLGLSSMNVLRQEVNVAKPLTAQFVKRQPRLTKPLELKKRPEPKRRPIRRRMVAVRARLQTREVAAVLGAAQALGSLAQPEPPVRQATRAAGQASEPRALAQVVEGRRESEHTLDTSLEMLDLEALDTGRYHAVVIQDPNDKRGIRGFFHIAMVHSRSMRGLSPYSLDTRQRRAILRLAEAMNRYTQTRTNVLGYYTFDSDEFLKTPWVYALARRSFKLTASEAANCGRYLAGGGLMFVDFILRSDEPSCRRMVADALATRRLVQAEKWHWERLPNSHPLYHCFFDFPDGPPVGCYWKSYGNWEGARPPWGYLQAVILDRRVVALLGDQRYANAWGDWGRKGLSTYAALDPTRPLQFGVNLLIFALTQEGSITHRLMEGVK